MDGFSVCPPCAAYQYYQLCLTVHYLCRELFFYYYFNLNIM